MVWGLRCSLMLVLASSACFHPDPSPGAPCGPGDTCPSGLACIDGFCGGGGSSSDSGIDADSGDAPIDSTPACDPDGAPRAAQLTSPLAANNGEEGNMFDIVATETITISTFDGHLGATGTTDYEIWTRPGTYVGNADSASGWTKLGSATFQSAGSGAYTPIPIPVNVTIQAGQRQAFYLTNKASNNRYHDGTQVGATLASNAELTLYQGAGINYGTAGFGGTNTPRSWEGRIHYRVGGGATLATPLAGTSSSDGIMFDVTAARDVEVSLLAVNLGAGTHDVDVYVRHGGFAGAETNAAQWQKLASIANVDSDGSITPLPGALGLYLGGGTTTALYIQTTTSTEVRSQPALGGNAAMNADLTIGQGVTISGTFGAIGSAAMPNVELGYGTCN